jgi:hypothetical protein
VTNPKLLAHLTSLRDLLDGLPQDPQTAQASLRFATVSLTLALEAFGGGEQEPKAVPVEKPKDNPVKKGSKTKPGINHGTTHGYQKGCRCEPCRGAMRIYNQANYARKKQEREAAAKPKKASKAKPSSDPAPVAHGTVEGFREHATRREPPCAPCWAAWQQWMPEIPPAPGETPPPAPEPVFIPIKHGTISAYKGKKCRCDLCRQANREAGRRTKENHRKARLETKDFAHGAHGYRYYGCRCDICRAGSTEAARKWRATHPRPSIRRPKPLVVLETPVASNPREIQHGTKNAYAYHGCRCELCTGAHTDAIYAAKDRRLQRAEAGMTFEHGLNGYRNYDCRCDICKAAKVEYARSKRSAA